jgi:hypothetical protein
MYPCVTAALAYITVKTMAENVSLRCLKKKGKMAT